MNHVAGPLHILLAEKEGRIWFSIICVKIYQFKRITWWCLSVLEFALEFVMKSAVPSCLEICHAGILKKKNHVFLEFAL